MNESGFDISMNYPKKEKYITGSVRVAEKIIPQAATTINFRDLLGTIMVRWGIRRNNYKVPPGLYAVGKPAPESDVFVSANYKLSFDTLRKNLSGLNGWILVLDTKGVNVWCAAGKGTFGTKELAGRIREAGLDKIVNHKRIILPQLGATGVSAHKVKEETGFNVHYGPVRAGDIKKFLKDRYRADKEMRLITFALKDRIKLVPNDFIQGKLYLTGAMALILLISFLSRGGISFKNFLEGAWAVILNIFLAYISGIVITPTLLPYIPSRYFSVKGFFSGMFMFIILLSLKLTGDNIAEKISWFFIVTTISSFLAMNFTGSSTFTSLSGVKKEMKISLPIQIGSAVIGIILQIVGKLI